MSATYNISDIVHTNISDFNIHQKNTIAKLKTKYPSEAKGIKFDFDRQLDKNYTEFVNDRALQGLAVQKFEDMRFVQSKMPLIANDFTLRQKDLTNFLHRYMYNEMHVNANNRKITDDVINIILETLGNTPEKTNS